jgi:hypothetical protein
MSTRGVIALATTTEDGLKLDDKSGFKRSVRRLPKGRVRVSVEPIGDKRSLDQNAYWWAVPVKLIAEHCGYTDAQMHYALLGECFGFTPGPTGHPVPVKPSSSELTLEEFKHLIDWVLIWAPTELGVLIPGPGEHMGRAS